MTLIEDSAKRVRALAKDQRFRTRGDDLASLAAAIDSGPLETQWSGVSLFNAFPPESTVSVRTKARLERLLGVLAGVTVFLPVAWTWWSLREASDAYQRTIADGGAAGASFLQLWTTGFNGQLSQAHQLGPMALISLLLITASICVIVLHRLATHRALRREREETLAAEAELASALTWAQQALVSRNVEDPAQVAALVRSSLSQRTAAHEATRETAERLRAAAEEAGATWRAGSDEAARTLVAATHQSGQSFRDAGGYAREQIAELLDAAARTTALAREQTEAAVTSASEGLRSSTAGVSDALLGFAAAQAALDESAGRLTAAVTELGHGSRSTIDRFHADLSALSANLDGMLDAIQGIQLELARTGAATRSQVSELSRAREATQYAAHELQAVSTNLASMVGVR